MASLYKRKESAVWWIKFRDPHTSQIKRESTRLAFDPLNTKRAKQLCAQRTYEESQIPTATPGERWDCWVDKTLTRRYGPDQRRAKDAWRNLKMFLDEKKILTPRQLLRAHCLDYLEWRAKPDLANQKYRAGHNTIALEIKVLAIVMTEAVQNEWAPFNPCRDLHIKRLTGKQKPELPAEAMTRILAGIEQEPEPRRTFLRHSFLIARYHGCRLTETHMNPMDDIHFNSNGVTATFRVKGGSEHTVNLHPALLPLFHQLRTEGRTETYPMPRSPAKDWFNFLNRCGIKRDYPGACFHSLRVTAATTLARRGVSEKKAMSYLGHASTTVHRSYVRLKPDDLDDCANALTDLTPPAADAVPADSGSGRPSLSDTAHTRIRAGGKPPAR